MVVDPGEVGARMERFEEVCRGAGVKLTHQRREIFRELAQTGDHPNVEKVFSRVRERMPNVSLDTVYRTVWLLHDLGLITTMGSPKERTRFDANLRTHHHFVCVECGLTRDFDSEHFDSLKPPKSARAWGSVETTRVEVRGICFDCAAAKKKSSGKRGRNRK